MSLTVITTRPAALLAACLLGLAPQAPRAQAPARETEGGDPLLTDQMPFCRHLAREVERLQKIVPPPHQEADQLATDGVRLCAIGLVITGVRRLRYALIELEGPDAGR